MSAETQIQVTGIKSQLERIMTCLRSHCKGKWVFQRSGHQPQLVQIHLFHIQIQSAIQIAAVKTHICISLHLEKNIIAGKTDSSNG